MSPSDTAFAKLRVNGVYQRAKNLGWNTRTRRQAMWSAVYSTEIEQGTVFITTVPDKRFYAILGMTSELVALPPHQRGGDKMLHYMYEMYGLDKSDPTTLAMYELFRTYADNEGARVELRRFSAYSQANRTAYLSGYNGSIWKLDGEQITQIKNGDEGIFFLDDDHGVPCEPDVNDHGILFDMLTSLNYEIGPGGIDADTQRRFLIVWMLALAFPDLLPDKPIMLLEGLKGSGKCLGKGTPVLKADGSVVPVETIRKGDRLMGPDGKARTVLSTNIGHGDLYRIDPLRGESWVCNDVHMLTLVYSQSEARNKAGKIIDVPLDRWSTWTDSKKNLWKQFSVGVDSFENQTNELPVDPYFLGIWFGDGTKCATTGHLNSLQITKPDPEIESLCRDMAAEWNIELRTNTPDNRCKNYTLVSREIVDGKHVNRLLTAIRDLVGTQINIPISYLKASRENRLAFLAGWLDSDGDLQSGCFSITQKREDWARAVWWLARSVGLCAIITKRSGGYTKADGTKFKGTYWRVSISGHLDQIPTRLPRKQAGKRLQRKTSTRTSFTATNIGKGDYYGFTLDGDGRFLLGDFTVTHNTLAPTLIQLALMGVDRIMAISQDQERDFGVLLLRAPIAILDNMDTFIEWIQDKICQYATQGTFPKRKLFSDDEEILIKPQSFVAITSREPRSFRREDVVDRLLIIRLKRWLGFKAVRQLKAQINENRSRLLGEYMYHVNRVVAAIRNGAIDETKIETWRMASFAAFVRVIGKVFGWTEDEVKAMLDAMQIERDIFEGEGDPLVEIMQEWIIYKERGAPPNIGREFALSELFKIYSNLAKEKGVTFYKHHNRLADKLGSSYVQRHFRVTMRFDESTATRYYRIWRITDPVLEVIEGEAIELGIQ